VIARLSIEWTARPYVAPSTTAREADRGAVERSSSTRRPHAVRRRLRTALSVAATLLVLGAAWWFLAPPPLGGSTTLVTIDGTSMLPRYSPSDLVALRPTEQYRVGDVVGYRSTLLGRVVMHRIVGETNGHYVVKGDNNGFVDPDRPADGDIVGLARVRIPSAGSVVAWLQLPAALAVLAGVLALVVGLGVTPRTGAR
jgi:signal peptidase